MAQCATCVPRLYKSIIEEVINSVKDDFLDEGIDEQVLLEVRQAWEQKVNATHAAEHNDSIGGGAMSLHNQHSSQQSQQQMQQSTHEQVTSGLTGQGAPQQPLQQPQPPAQAAPGSNLVPVQITVPAQQAGGTAKTITIHVPSSALANGVAGAQLQTILSAPAAAQTFALEANLAARIIQQQLNAALQKRGIVLPPQLIQMSGVTQMDGAADSPVSGCSCKVHKNESATKQKKSSAASSSSGAASSESLSLSVDRATMDSLLLERLGKLQVDGPIDDSSDEMSGDDDDDDDEKEEEEDKDKKFDDDEEDEEVPDGNEDPLNSADDVSEDESGEAFDTENVVVCQYDKVTRVRNKWRFNLKDGIMNLKGKDYVFLKATGEGEW